MQPTRSCCPPTPSAGTPRAALQVTPSLIGDVAHDEDLVKAVTEALDTQLCAELPLEYHAVYLAQQLLKVGKRRDAAWPIPLPERDPPAPLRRNASEAAQEAWAREQAEYVAYLEGEWWPARMTSA
eukprot:2286755-Prymnesium_polylepis.1